MMTEVLTQYITENLPVYVSTGMSIGFIFMALLCLIGYVVSKVQSLV